MHLTQKVKPYGLVRIKIELINRNKRNDQSFLKIVNLGNSILDNSKWDKISESIGKKTISGIK